MPHRRACVFAGLFFLPARPLSPGFPLSSVFFHFLSCRCSRSCPFLVLIAVPVPVPVPVFSRFLFSSPGTAAPVIDFFAPSCAPGHLFQPLSRIRIPFSVRSAVCSFCQNNTPAPLAGVVPKRNPAIMLTIWQGLPFGTTFVQITGVTGCRSCKVTGRVRQKQTRQKQIINN